ncbi:hypothetical protein C7212DRAFT_347659 [Tuber magnatum]|uniref:Uncharacterized protein n=1 Tax=Tuber magnatum TaxID=42249 RepID=A0A317SER1_9PEZI|nr:hypothetical protein C7212DRAFT_347659 [Tuber magnatum]
MSNPSLKQRCAHTLRCDTSSSNGFFSKHPPDPPHGGVDHMRSPGGFKWRGVSKEMHKDKWGKKFGKGEYRWGKGRDSDSNSNRPDSNCDSNFDDEHHRYYHHRHYHGMDMGRCHSHKGGRRHNGRYRHD